MKFAFLVHPLTDQMRQLVELNRKGEFKESWGKDLVRFLDHLATAVDGLDVRIANKSTDHPHLFDELADLRSDIGASAEGRIYEIPMLAHEILEQPQRAITLMEQAAADAHAWGAKLIGLGSMTGIVGGRGSHLAEQSPLAVTTGNSLTVFAALENLTEACREINTNLSEENVAIVGIPGSIATAAARLLVSKCKSLVLVGRRSSVRTQRLCEELNAEFTCDVAEALSKCKIVVSATSSGDCIFQKDLLPGSIVVDVAVPTDVVQLSEPREDVLILSGGLTQIPESMSLNSAYFWFQNGMIPSCLGETTLLALENRPENYSVGQDLSPEGILEIGQRAKKHGFRFNRLYSFGLELAEERLIRFRKRFRPRTGIVYTPHVAAPGTAALKSQSQWQPTANGHHASNGEPTSADSATPESISSSDSNGAANVPHSGDASQASIGTGYSYSDVAKRARALHHRHINPIMTELGGDLVKTFVRGQGCHVWDEQGNQYLDFVGGFGSLNTGHNHPKVVEAIQQGLQIQLPGFVQSAINPLAAHLAERLTAIAPDTLEMAFFTNSGTESVEAALKMARAASNRERFLFCDRSYHGKTMGSLSVTGNRNYQDPFKPLMPGNQVVDFGDFETLHAKLKSKEFAAFIVEPIQAEGGMHSADKEYFQKVEQACRETGTLLILDEVQTGLGRTGKMFAADHFDIQPDMMTLAKSLGGGIVPIGALLFRASIWQKAYGTADRFALHTSTFGGGSMACAASLAALDVIEEDGLIDNASKMGEMLLDGLSDIVNKYEILKQVRGRGLLMGVEFSPLLPSVVRHWKAVDVSMMQTFLGSRLDEILQCIPALYVMNSLLNRHQIYTQTARSNPRVIRIQPPLTVNEDQVQTFLTAFSECCENINYSIDLVDGMFSRTSVGNHRAEKAVVK